MTDDPYNQLSSAAYMLRQYVEPMRQYRDQRKELRNAMIETFPYKSVSDDGGNDDWHEQRIVVTHWTRDGASRRAELHKKLDALNCWGAREIKKQKALKIIVDQAKKEIERRRRAAAA